jgi:DNA-binding HxlR family transcriptional regulator
VVSEMVRNPERERLTSTKEDLRTERLTDLMKLLSDDKSVLIFNTIFLAGGGSSEILRAQLEISRKQYYSRISRLVKVGLVRRQTGGRYFVTAFGRVIYGAQKLIGSALRNYWKLKAIDSLGLVAHDGKITEGECTMIIDQMIDSQLIKEILLSKNL